MRARTVSKSRAGPASASARRVAAAESRAEREAERLDSSLVTDLLLGHGLLILFALIAIESAGVPLPGRDGADRGGRARVPGAIPLDRGRVVVAALAAIIGDNIGYWVGRKGGRALPARDADRPRRVRAGAAARRSGSSSATARRRSSSAASSRSCASRRPGSRGSATCPGGGSSSGMRSAESSGQRVVGRRRLQVRRGRRESDQQIRPLRRDRRRRRRLQSSSSCFGSGRSECSKTPRRELFGRATRGNESVDAFRQRFPVARFPLHYHVVSVRLQLEGVELTWLGEQSSYAITVARKSVRTREHVARHVHRRPARLEGRRPLRRLRG